MKKILSRFLSIMLFTILSYVPSAQATVCTISNLTLSSSCQTGTTNNDFLNPLQVNIDAMHSFTDWEFAQKWDHDQNQITDELIDLMLNISPKMGNEDIGTEGNWSVAANIWDLYHHAMIVMKGGNIEYVGYLIANGEVSGMYSSPFVNPNTLNLKDVSHWSLYVRGTAVTVSEPSMFFLFIFSFLGLILIRR